MDTKTRAEILQRLRDCPLDPVPLPDLEGDWITFADPVDQFCRVLETVGGTAQRADSLEHVAQLLGELPAFATASRVCSQVPSAVPGNVDLGQVADPHRLEDVDFFLAAGEFAVAENGAVWVSDASLPHRVLYFVVQHLALIVPVREVLHNLSEAYDRLTFGQPGFGLFLSGPSKTADIEQSLVIGAHGARSLTVFLVEDGEGISAG